MFDLNKTWQLDSRLEADTFPIMSYAECSFRLMNDSRWPWVIIVPQVAGAEELHDLSKPQIDNALMMATQIGGKLKSYTGGNKINTAAIGNIVRQLHIHVVARNEGDPNWPAPIWGYGTAEKYSGAEGKVLAEKLKEEFRASLFS
ncbi:MAG: HIT family protein [Rhizobiaceae bacterium]